LQIALTVHAARSAAEPKIVSLHFFSLVFLEEFEAPCAGAAPGVHLARSANIRVEARRFRARRAASGKHMEQRPLQLATSDYNPADVRAAQTARSAGGF
jgi:hypothetical protein